MRANSEVGLDLVIEDRMEEKSAEVHTTVTEIFLSCRFISYPRRVNLLSRVWVRRIELTYMVVEVISLVSLWRLSRHIYSKLSLHVARGEISEITNRFELFD